MPVRFILAPAGGGKTYYCLSEISRLVKDAPLGRPVYFILPEQATFIHERLLCEANAGGGFCRARVCSFNRLVHYAYKERGETPSPQLSEAGKLLLAGRVIGECRNELHIYGAAAAGAGFSAYLVKAAEELATYGIDPETLEKAVERLILRDGQTRQTARLREVALLYRKYRSYEAQRYGSYVMNMAYLSEVIRKGFITDADIYIDGYAEFTPAEYAVIEALFNDDNRRISIALPVDPALIDKEKMNDHVFSTPMHTWGKLSEMAKKQGMTIDPPLMLSGERGRFAANPELAKLEAMLAGRSYPQEGKVKPCSMMLRQAADQRAELTGIGREIIRLTREEGLRYRDISIVTRDTAPYAQLLAEIFPDMGIPYFIDAKKTLLWHPLFELIRSAMENWAYHPTYERIIRFCKNSLLPVCLCETDLLDNYALAHGLRYWHWVDDKPWNFPLLPGEEEGLAAVADSIRRRACGPLFAGRRDLPKEVSAITLNERLTALLDALQIKEAMAALAGRARAEGRGEEAAQHEQAWDKLKGFLDEAGLLLGETLFPLSHLLKLYDAALLGLTVSTIPPGIDQVFVSSLERSRTPEIKAAFVPTVNEGVLPRKIVMEGLFTDEDRRGLRTCGAALAPDTPTRQFKEDYLAYIALTRSAGRLYLSYVTEDGQGKAMKPSPLIRRVKAAFPGLEAIPFEPFGPEHLIGGELDLAQTATHLCRVAAGREEGGFWDWVYAFYADDPQYGAALSQVQNGLYYQPLSRPLAKSVLNKLYGQTLRGSVSRLEKFRLCPFAYFAAYGLKLAKRPTYELDAASRGQLFHQVLADIGTTVLTKQLDWRRIDEVTAADLVDTALEKYLPQILAGILRSSARYSYLSRRIRDALVGTILLLAEHTRRGEFIPVAWELPFGSDEPDSLPAFKIDLPGGKTLELSGRIDRVDMAVNTDGSKRYVRIVDYKSGQISLKPEDIFAGLRLQLLVYLQVVMANARVFGDQPAEAAGIYYAEVGDSLAAVNKDREATGLKLSGLTVRDMEAIRLADREINGNSSLIPAGLGKNGIYSKPAGLSADQLHDLEQRLLDILRETAGDMLEGLISVSPLRDTGFDACAYCDFASVCGFDQKLSAPRKKARFADEEPPRSDHGKGGKD